MKKTLLCAGAILAGSSAFAANPVTVGPTGDFATIQAAIASFSSTGSNNGETAPLVINIDPSVTYDEALDLNDANVGSGDVVGDIVIQSATPGTLVPIALQLGIGATDDGLLINQQTANVTLRDLLIYPSLTNPFTDEMIKIDANAADAVDNLILFESCVLTEIDGAGNPLITDKESALQPAPATIGSSRTGFAYIMQHWGDAGELFSTRLEDCAIYGNLQNATLRVAFVGGATESFEIDNSYIAGGGSHLLRYGSGDGGGSITVTDSTFYDAGAAAHLVWFSGANTAQTPASFSGCSFIDPTAGDTSRGVSGSANVDITSIDDCIFSTPGPNLVDNAVGLVSVSNTTFHTTEATNGILIVPNTGSISVTDSIFSGDGTKLAATAAGTGITTDFVAYAEAGPHAIGARNDGSVVVTEGANIVTADPEYASIDPLAADGFTVTSSAYAGAGSGASDLAGGGVYNSASLNDWSQY